MTQRKSLLILAIVIALIGGLDDISVSKTRAMTAQTVYVPVYSSIYYGDREREFNLAVTISIRNTDMKNPITLVLVDYYNTSGKILQRYLPGKQTLKPLESIHYVVRESDIKGGIGANFIIRWRSSKPVSAPVMESVMIGTGGQQGISFTSRGVVISEE